MTNLTNQTIVSRAWEFIENISATPGNIAIAGGAIADTFFGKEVSDLDVFVSYEDLSRLQLFCTYYGFEPAITPERFREVEDSYGNPRRVRIGNQETDITVVYKGTFLGYPMDLVVVQDTDVAKHIETKFDQSVKSCWFNGEYHYSDAFMSTVASGIIEPIRHESSSYVRAWLSADKYDLELSSMYNLSKHYCGYAYKHDKLDKILSASTINKIEGIEEKLFHFDVERANVILMDVFMKHEPKNHNLYRKLCAIADKEIVARHPLAGRSVDIIMGNSEHHNFICEINSLSHTIDYSVFGDIEDLSAEEQDALTALKPLRTLSEEMFLAGKCIDNNGREARLGKYIKKIERKHHDVIAAVDGLNSLHRITRMVEVRSTQNKAKVFITGSKHALTHISTKTEWKSCQRWGGFGSRIMHNYGLLANVSGSSLVAYVADERSDNKSSNWKARILIRIGVDGSLVLERTYSGRAEYYTDDSLRRNLCDQLNAEGYRTYMTQEDAIDFKSLPLWSVPYQDCSDIMNLESTKDSYIFRGRRKEIEKQRRVDALSKAIVEVIDQTEIVFTELEKYTRTFCFPVPAHLEEEMNWYVSGHYGRMYIQEYSVPAYEDYTSTTAVVDRIDGVFMIMLSQSVPHYKRLENQIHRPQGFQAMVPRPQMVPVIRNAGGVLRQIGVAMNAAQLIDPAVPTQHDGDNPFCDCAACVDNDLPF